MKIEWEVNTKLKIAKILQIKKLNKMINKKLMKFNPIPKTKILNSKKLINIQKIPLSIFNIT